MTPEATWSRNLFDALNDGGTWGVPRSGLIFTKRGEEFVLTARMPWMEGMPITAAQVDEQQLSDFEAIRRHMADAGITVTDETSVEFPIVILDHLGVVDRVATVQEAEMYVTEGRSREQALRWERSQ